MPASYASSYASAISRWESPANRSVADNEMPSRTLGPPGLSFTTYFLGEGRVEMRLPGGDHTGWWLQVIAYTYAWSAPPLPRQVPTETLLVIWHQVTPSH